jgi:hypothetical protein
VLDPEYDHHLAELRKAKPEIYRVLEQRLSLEYEEVFRNAVYRVLRRTAAGP